MSPIDEQQMNALATAVAAGEITYTDEPVVVLPPQHDGTEIMAVYSTRLPATLAERIAAIAKAKGVKPATLMRQYIEFGVAAEENDRPISLSDALRALTQLRPTL